MAISAYGMATLEGPLLSTKWLNAIAHYTDWVPAHVHVGTLGWNGFMIFGMVYWLLPRLWKGAAYSEKMAHWHFWLGLPEFCFGLCPCMLRVLPKVLCGKN